MPDAIAHEKSWGTDFRGSSPSTGDDGTTGLGDGSRVGKDSARIAAIGDVDELNSTLGVLLAETLPASVRDTLIVAQHDLFDLGGELSIPGYSGGDRRARRTPRGGGRRASTRTSRRSRNSSCRAAPRSAALAHVARTVCRRAERALVRLAAEAAVNDPARRYLNRLSDLLFVLARTLNRAAGRGDVLWQKDRSRSA